MLLRLFILSMLFLSNLFPQDIIYQSNKFTIYSDSITNGEYKAVAKSNTQLESNYLEAFEDGINREVRFKFCINDGDNENLSGLDHSLFINPINGKQISPIYRFGEINDRNESSAFSNTDNNFNEEIEITFRVDMTEVLKNFENNGYYVTKTGSKILKDQFDYLTIAGSIYPLDWNFGTKEKGAINTLLDNDHDGIYEVTLKFKKSATRKFENGNFIWQLKKDISDLPKYSDESKLLEALYNLSLEEMLLDIREDQTFMAGAKWNGVWTRDISYSIILSLAALNPEISKKSLMAKVKNGIIIQDTGTGGSWPVSTDRMVWILAAWEIFKVTGEITWLNQIYPIIKKSIDADLHNIFDEKTGLVFGESSFLDWREQTYPDWMDPKDIYVSKTLGTNAVHYQVYSVVSEMANLLDKPKNEYSKKAEQIKKGINNYLWLEESQAYSQFLYGRNYLSASNKTEALGSSLCLLYDIVPLNKTKAVLANFPISDYGVTCIYPQITNIPNYHNNGIWPFVNSYFAWAAAKFNNTAVVEHILASNFRAAALFLTNKENMVAKTGSPIGTEINSDRQLWSVAGNLSSFIRIFFGMNFDIDGIRFNPFVPKPYSAKRSLNNFKYRDALLNITLIGHGNEIAEFYLDELLQDEYFLPGNLKGNHNLKIVLKNNSLESKINLVKEKFAPETPSVKISKNRLYWNSIDNADHYLVYSNGEKISTTKSNEYLISEEDKDYKEYQIVAMDKEGISSFLSEPKIANNHNIILMQDSTQNLPITISKTKSIEVVFQVDIKQEDEYLIDFEYANGNGPINTDNKCAIRTLLINDNKAGTVVFPQRGKGLWDDWGFTNSIKYHFSEGVNSVKIIFDELNENMNFEINEAKIKSLRLTRLNN